MTDALHPAAAQGFAREAATYARGRPEYPAAISAWLTKSLGIGPGSRVVDVGAGTGKFTRLLVAAGATVSAIEPVEAMRDELAHRLPDVTVLGGTAQALPLPDACVDAIVCAQAFHWFATVEALAEFRRVLKPGGRLGLVWNVRDESVDWVTEITRIISPLEGDAPRFHTGKWRQPFASGLFTPPALTALLHTHTGSVEEVILDRFMSVSFIAAAPEAARAQVHARLAHLAATHPALAGRSAIAFPYRTEAYCCEPVRP